MQETEPYSMLTQLLFSALLRGTCLLVLNLKPGLIHLMRMCEMNYLDNSEESLAYFPSDLRNKRCFFFLCVYDTFEVPAKTTSSSITSKPNKQHHGKGIHRHLVATY